MITNLCNIYSELNLDTFYKIRVIEASQLPKFNHLMPKQDVLSILNDLPDSLQAMDIPLLPEKHTLKNDTRVRNGNKTYSTRLSFPLVPQDENIKKLLETYNNRLVVALMIRRSYSYLYGTSSQPLLFTYDELHANIPNGLKGFNITMDGDSYGEAKYFPISEGSIMPDVGHLAFDLAGTL